MASSDILLSLPSSTSLGNAVSPAVETFDLAVLQRYLQALLPVLLSAHPNALQSTLFAEDSWIDIAESFANDASVAVVYIDKMMRETINEDNEESEPCGYKRQA